MYYTAPSFLILPVYLTLFVVTTIMVIIQMMILFSSTGHCRPSLKDLCEHVVPTVADKWKDIGVHLLDSTLLDQRVLEVIAADHPHSVEACCKSMFEKWLSTQEKASWNQVIEAIQNVGLCYLASQLETKLKGEYIYVILCMALHSGGGSYWKLGGHLAKLK